MSNDHTITPEQMAELHRVMSDVSIALATLRPALLNLTAVLGGFPGAGVDGTSPPVFSLSPQKPAHPPKGGSGVTPPSDGPMRADETGWTIEDVRRRNRVDRESNAAAALAARQLAADLHKTGRCDGGRTESGTCPYVHPQPAYQYLGPDDQMVFWLTRDEYDRLHQADDERAVGEVTAGTLTRRGPVGTPDEPPRCSDATPCGYCSHCSANGRGRPFGRS